MTPEAVLYSACALIGIRDPAEFYRLAPSVQEGWLEHATNLATGAYGKERKRKPSPTAAADAKAAEQAFLAAQARKRVADEPR